MHPAIEHLIHTAQGKHKFSQHRSPKWPEIRDAHKRKYPRCEVTGETNGVEVHHIFPFHLFPDKELDPDNLVTLKEKEFLGLLVHLFVGHSGNYHNFNGRCIEDILYMRAKLMRLNPSVRKRFDGYKPKVRAK